LKLEDTKNQLSASFARFKKIIIHGLALGMKNMTKISQQSRGIQVNMIPLMHHQD